MQSVLSFAAIRVITNNAAVKIINDKDIYNPTIHRTEPLDTDITSLS
jgi:hypothetical protein